MGRISRRRGKNPVASVRADAEQKQLTIDELEELESIMAIFRDGNILQKSICMFDPKRFGSLEKTLGNFKPGLPLSLEGIVFGLALGLSINLLVMTPVYLGRRVLRRRRGRGD